MVVAIIFLLSTVANANVSPSCSANGTNSLISFTSDAEAGQPILLDEALSKVLFLQTTLQIENNGEQVADNAHTTSEQTLVAANWTGGCQPLTYFDMQYGLEVLRSLGLISNRPGCIQHLVAAKKLSANGALANGLLQFPGGPGSDTTVESLPAVAYLLAAFFSIYALVCICVARTIFTKPSIAGPPEKESFSPELDSWNRGLLNWLMIDWATPWLIRYGNAHDTSTSKIETSRLGETADPDDSPEQSCKRFLEVWNADIKAYGEEKMNMHRVIFAFSTYRKVASIACISFLWYLNLFLAPTYAIDWTLNFLNSLEIQRRNDPDAITWDVLFWPTVKLMILFTVCPLLMVASNSAQVLITQRLDMRLQGALSAALYQKAQRLPAWLTTYDLQDSAQKEETEKAGGQNDVVKYTLSQLIMSDVGKQLIGLQSNVASIVAVTPIFLYLTFLVFARLGKATVIPMIIIMLNSPALWKTGAGYAYRLRMAAYMKAMALNVTKEALFGIRMFKPNGWEEAASIRCAAFRNDQLHHSRLSLLWLGVMSAIAIGFPKVLVLGSLSGFVWMFHNLSPSEIFVVMQLLNAYKGVVNTITGSLPPIINVGPSLRRLDLFLKLKEGQVAGNKSDHVGPWISIWPEQLPQLMDDKPKSEPVLRVQGSFAWDDTQAKCALTDVDVAIKKGELVAIVGEVGSGKTTLLNAMLGELNPMGDARIEVPGKVAYHAQVPLIVEGTLRDNVLYWSAYDERRYNDSIYAASLQSDLQILPGGDLVRIGGRGIALSGGQRARVSLARCAYASDAEVLLLDDPFASVDMPTGQHLLSQLILGPLMTNRTRVVVCQPDPERLKEFDRIIVMSAGHVKVQGIPSEILQTSEFQMLLSSQPKGKADAEPSAVKQVKENKPVSNSTQAVNLREEEIEGRADWSTIDYFIRLGSYAYFIGYLTCMGGNVFVLLMGDMVLASWTNNLIYSSTPTSPWVYIGGSLFWLLLSQVVFSTGWVIGANWSTIVSKEIYNTVLNRLLYAPVDWFYDRTPVGRIMNRFTTDIDVIDYGLFAQSSACVGQLFTIGVPVAYVHSILPLYLTFLLLPLHMLIFTTMKRYWYTLMPIKYLITSCSSRVSNCIMEAESSYVTVRAFQVANQQATVQKSAVKDSLKAQFTLMMVKMWVKIRLTMLFAFFTTCIPLVGIYCPYVVSIGTIGLCLSSCASILMQIEWNMACITGTQHLFVSMQRLQEYTCVQQERAREMPTDNRYSNHNLALPRSALRNLEPWQDEKGQLQVVRVGGETFFDPCQPCRMCAGRLAAPEDTGTKKHNALMQQLADTETFVATTGTLASLDPYNENLKALEPWHRITAVNSVVKNATRMAEELCYGHSDVVHMNVQSGWLADGAKVVIEDLVAGYADNRQDVLKGVNLTIERKQKVAVCGTTGCGKSTLLLCLLRMIEARGGAIKIEGVNIADIGLRALRRSLGLVPQDPIVFSGTMRTNVDPFTEYTDERIWQALRAVKLAKLVEQSNAGLYMTIKADGENLSFGQRQLLCIARMILRQPQVLLLDEATSAIDPVTQEIIQASIHEFFPTSTIIAIAHRLETIMDFDMVFVMEKGVVVEKGSPDELSKMKSSIFARMLAEQ